MSARLCLVTGGAGFIGSHIVEALLERGDRVRVLDNLSTGRRQNLDGVVDAVEFIEADVGDLAAVERAMGDVEVVFHQAALPSVPLSLARPLDTHRDCVTGTVHVLDAARRAGVRRIVYAASSSAYGDQPFMSVRETDLPQTRSPYAAAKLAGEHYCQAFYYSFGLETVGLRYFNVFGPRQDPNSPYSAVIPRFITALLQGQAPTIYGDGRQTRDFCYVGEVARANLLAADADGVAGRIINLASGRATDLLGLLAVLNRLLGCNVHPQFEPPRAGDVRDSLADISQARRWLGYETHVDLEEGLRRSIAHYRFAPSLDG